MGRLQVAKEYTIKVTKLDDKSTIGTGIVIESGRILTCAHVVRDATGHDPRYDPWCDVGIVFPQTSQGDRIYPARIVACLQSTPDNPGYEDDIVLLELKEGQPPIAPENYARLGYAKNSLGNPFQSLTYVPVDVSAVNIVSGKILSYGLSGKKMLHIDTVQLLTDDPINPGMSGAGILDESNNHVVGLLTERMKNSNDAWMTDHAVLTFEPFNTHDLQLHTDPYKLTPIRQPQPEFDLPTVHAGLQHQLEGAPSPLAEWVGRDQLLRDLDADMAEPDVRLTGLIGFGGEGKSSLARRWVDHLLAGDTLSHSLPEKVGTKGEQVDGVFWWAFYGKADVEAFLEAAITWLGGEHLAKKARSATTRAVIIGALLREGRYVFVLDGLEVMQEQEGDQYGQIRSTPLRELLDYFAAEGHLSFCLLTSRVPLLDLLSVTTYRHHNVARLNPNVGRALLQRLGATNDNADLDAVVQQWDGHALTLSLVGTLAMHYGGDARAASAGLQITPLAEDTRRTGRYADQYDHVRRVLLRYDEHLTEEERTFLQRFSVFRTPVEVVQIGKLEAETLKVVVTRLAGYRLLRRDLAAGTITMHPLVRNYYLAKLQAEEAMSAHEQAKQYYLARASDTPYNPTLADLEPLVEAVHHACLAGAYDQAIQILDDEISQGDRHVLIHQLGAYEKALNILIGFFPNQDMHSLPSLINKSDQLYLFGWMGTCLQGLGRLAEAMTFYERSVTVSLEVEDWDSVCIGYQNLANLQILLGGLAGSLQAAQNLLRLSRRTKNKDYESNSLAILGWSVHLIGDVMKAAEAFQEAEALYKEEYPDQQYLDRNLGIYHADHLRRTGDGMYARRITETNLTYCQDSLWVSLVSQCHRLLGYLDADGGDHSRARDHFDEALRLARSIQKRDVLIEALLARGYWRAYWALQLEKLQDFGNLSMLMATAHDDLDEALGYAISGNYLLYECDIRIGLAWVYHHNGNHSIAQQYARRAATLAHEMDYHWGQLDAAKIATLL